MEDLFRDPRLAQLRDYWLSRKGNWVAPRRSDIDLTAIPSLLPILQMIEVSHNPVRFRHRLVGTEVVEAMGRDVTGDDIDRHLYGEAAEEIAGSLEDVVREVRPYRRVAHLTWHERDWLEMEAIELPLVEDEGQVVTLLCGVSFHRREPGPGPRLVHEPLPD